MSEREDTKGLIHPITADLVSLVKETNTALRKKEYINALGFMRSICITMEAKDRDPDLFDKISKEENQAQGTESSRQYRRHLTSSAHTYWKWADQLNQRLYDKGYYSMEKFNRGAGLKALRQAVEGDPDDEEE